MASLSILVYHNSVMSLQSSLQTKDTEHYISHTHLSAVCLDLKAKSTHPTVEKKVTEGYARHL